MFCSKCGFQNAEGDGFCGRCGAPLRTAAAAGGPAPTIPPAPPAAYGAAPSPAGKPNVAVVAVVAVAALVLGAAGAYVALRGGPPRPGTPAAGTPPQPLPIQASMQAYSDPKARFKIRYPQGWKAFPADDITVFSQSDIGSAKGFELSQVTAPTIVVFPTEKVNKEVTAAEVVSQSGIEKESNTQIIGRRSGKLSMASGAADAIWVDVLVTDAGKQIRGRIVFAVRRPGDGTTTKGGATCVSPPEAFAAFDRACSATLDSYEF